MATKTITITQLAGGGNYSFDNTSSAAIEVALTDGPAPSAAMWRINPDSTEDELFAPKLSYTLWARSLAEAVDGEVESGGTVRIGSTWTRVDTMTSGNTAFFYDVD